MRFPASRARHLQSLPTWKPRFKHHSWNARGWQLLTLFARACLTPTWNCNVLLLVAAESICYISACKSLLFSFCVRNLSLSNLRGTTCCFRAKYLHRAKHPWKEGDRVEMYWAQEDSRLPGEWWEGDVVGFAKRGRNHPLYSSPWASVKVEWLRAEPEEEIGFISPWELSRTSYASGYILYSHIHCLHWISNSIARFCDLLAYRCIQQFLPFDFASFSCKKSSQFLHALSCHLVDYQNLTSTFRNQQELQNMSKVCTQGHVCWIESHVQKVSVLYQVWTRRKGQWHTSRYRHRFHWRWSIFALHVCVRADLNRLKIEES